MELLMILILSSMAGIKIVLCKDLKPSLISEHSKEGLVCAWAPGLLLCGSRQLVRQQHANRLHGSRPERPENHVWKS